MATKTSATISVTYKKSAIGYNQTHRDTLRILGFKRLGQTLELADKPTVRGMLHKVQHLVSVAESPKK
ncbi:MAG: 50S ribosomal protein L30 [bacterium]